MATPLTRQVKASLDVDGARYSFFSLSRFAQGAAMSFEGTPHCLKILVENVLRHATDDREAINLVRTLTSRPTGPIVVPFRPARVLMQDYSGMPVLIDMAGLRQDLAGEGHNPALIDLVIPVDFVIDHSLIIDQAGNAAAHQINVDNEFRRNDERYRFLRWAEQAFQNFRLFPPGTGILHQLNLERIASVVATRTAEGETIAFPDALVGTDSHTTMINGAGVLGWGVGGIDAQAAVLGEPIVISIPEVVGVMLTGALREGVTATDAVLTLTQALRRFGVIDRFLEFTGPALDGALSLADRATIANMAPEFGSSCAFFPIDGETIRYLRMTGRPDPLVALVEQYARAQGLYREPGAKPPVFNRMMEFDLGDVEPCVAGPRRPHERLPLSCVADALVRDFPACAAAGEPRHQGANSDASGGANGGTNHGDIVIAAITSCTNTSNPSLMFAAGLLAQKAVARGLSTKPWVKTSFTPGSPVVGEYLRASGLQSSLDALGFQVAGYGCGTCSGNSGNLIDSVSKDVDARDLVVCAVLSGNRNFEGRIHPQVRANFLMTPPLVVAYALLGSMSVDIATQPVGHDPLDEPVFLKDIWPSSDEIAAMEHRFLSRGEFAQYCGRAFESRDRWESLPQQRGLLFSWDPDSAYIRRPQTHSNAAASGQNDLLKARPLVMLGDSITTDHISPVGSIPIGSPAGAYLRSRGVEPHEFNSYGTRRGDHEVMVRATFANPRLHNLLAGGLEGGVTRHMPSEEIMSVFDAARRYARDGVPLVILAGKEYGGGSARDWAAKGTKLLGVKAVIAESFERIHRANLVSMGVLPLEFQAGTSTRSLTLDGSELFDIGLPQTFKDTVRCKIHRLGAASVTVHLCCRLDNARDFEVWASGGIIPLVLKKLA